MSYEIKLPLENDISEYYEMRLESIGGLGANLCGKMLGELGALYLNLNAASFSSYGSEKRGSPVKAYVRWSPKEKNIRINSPVEHPHILGLFHDAMLGKMSVTNGVSPYTKTVINTAKNPEELKIELLGEVYYVDGERIAMDTGSRINMIMLGAVTRISGFIPLDAVIELAKNTIGKKYPDLIDKNIEGIKRGYEDTKHFSIRKEVAENMENQSVDEVIWGYRNAPIGGINPIYGSTVSNDLSASREGYIPLFVQDRCINCGLCDTTCPDMVFQFEKGVYRDKEMMVNTGLDYTHCKGCLRCVDVCPVNALVTGVEREHPYLKWNKNNKDIITNDFQYDKVGANSYVTSESYLQEKRVDGDLDGGVV